MKMRFPVAGCAVLAVLVLAGTARAIAYNTIRATAYANKYCGGIDFAVTHDPMVPYFAADCTGFASAIALAGGQCMSPKKKVNCGHNKNWLNAFGSFTNNKEWFARKVSGCDQAGGFGYSAAWATVDGFRRYWCSKSFVTCRTYTSTNAEDLSDIASEVADFAVVGDFIQYTKHLVGGYAAQEGHTMYVKAKSEGQLTLAYHTTNRCNAKWCRTKEQQDCIVGANQTGKVFHVIRFHGVDDGCSHVYDIATGFPDPPPTISESRFREEGMTLSP